MVDILLLYFQHFYLIFVNDKPHFPSKMVVRFNYNIQHANDDSKIFISTGEV